jgi:serine/threonine protein phosphatase 1
MRAIWAIGDVHGQSQMLAQLLTLLPRSPDDATVFLGDYIDRGPNSKGVVNQVLAEIDAGAIALWGNHEDMAAAAYGFSSIGKLDREVAAAMWLYPANGGNGTLLSFEADFPGACPEALSALFPLLRTHWVDPACGLEFVHACAPPGRSLSAVAREEPKMYPSLAGASLLLWGAPIPDRLDVSRAVVVGHTSIESELPERRGNYLLLDTNAARGGPLTALCLWPGHALTAFQVFPDGRHRILSETESGAWK